MFKARIVATFKCLHCYKEFDITYTPLLSEAAIVSLTHSSKLNDNKVRADLICPNCQRAIGITLMEMTAPFRTISDLSVAFLAIEQHLQSGLVKQLKKYGFRSFEVKE